jgi:hypothetical protein
MHDAAAVPWDEALSGWRSHFVTASTQLRDQESELLAIVGRRLTVGWTGWNPYLDRWFPDMPLVLVFDHGARLELAWQRWDALSVTWNTIDLTVPPEVLGRPYEWRSSQPESVAAVAGRTVTAVATKETPYFTGDVDFSNGLPMHEVSGWMISGLWFEFGDVGLLVYNRLDANGLSANPTQPGYEDATRTTYWPRAK